MTLNADFVLFVLMGVFIGHVLCRCLAYVLRRTGHAARIERATVAAMDRCIDLAGEVARSEAGWMLLWVALTTGCAFVFIRGMKS